jgi:hypothetical protein
MKTQIETLETLTGKKATILKFSEGGFPHSIKCVITKVYKKDYAQYDNCIHVNYKPIGKRSEYVWRIFDYQNFAIFAGHVELNTEMFVSTKQGEGVVIRESLLCFSPDYITRALSSTKEVPVLLQNKEMEVAENLDELDWK